MPTLRTTWRRCALWWRSSNARFPDVGKILVIGLSGKRVPAEVLGALAKQAKAILVTGASYKGQDPEKVRDGIDCADWGVRRFW